jgi:farnesyl diphosphate synthase
LLREIAVCAAETEAFLDRFLVSARLGGTNPDNGAAPASLIAAMRHGALGGGKRIRPFALRTSAGLFGVEPQATIAAGAAIECVHCYSLIHDDLPDMDNDTLRRAKPSVWKAFGPAAAILAGDALQAQAFAILASPETHPDAALRAMLVAELARGAGAMAGGQMADLEAEGKPLSPAAIASIQAMKTGALIGAAIRIGALMGRANPQELASLESYGWALGAVFQLTDDLLDATENTQTLGKTAGKDAAQNKATLVALEGVAETRRRRETELRAALAALDPFGAKGEKLAALVRHIAERTS